jgi:hypothetical protein
VCLLCDEEDNETYRSLKLTKTQRRRKFLNNKWPNMSEEITVRKLLTCNKVTELRKLVTLTQSLKCEWVKHVKEIHRRWKVNDYFM